MEIKLYRKNNQGQPCVWSIRPGGNFDVIVSYGIIGKTIREESIPITKRDYNTEIKSKVNEKLKVGYKPLDEIRDDHSRPPVEDGAVLISWLTKYLPDYRTTADGTLLPMLAKLYEDTVFKKVDSYIGQWKINGLRCFITAYRNRGDMFKPIGLRFQSREGEYWNTLVDLEDYLLNCLPDKVIEQMIEECIVLDGEIYLPGHSVNEINHFVKTLCSETKLLQFWCYDVAIDEMIQNERCLYMFNNLYDFKIKVNSIEDHLNNTRRFVILPTLNVVSDDNARVLRNHFISLGFEGLIMRNPNATYQYGKRNLSMIKYKAATDGKFTIVDIYKEPKRDVPILLCRNDINDETFETRLSDNHDNQRKVLYNKDQFIGKEVFIKFGERSGVKRVPMHIRDVTLI